MEERGRSLQSVIDQYRATSAPNVHAIYRTIKTICGYRDSRKRW